MVAAENFILDGMIRVPGLIALRSTCLYLRKERLHRVMSASNERLNQHVCKGATEGGNSSDVETDEKRSNKKA